MKTVEKNQESPLVATSREEDQKVEIRIHPGEGSPLIYLPGVHGDWTLVGGFRRVLGDKVRFIEVTYPRTETWSLNTYAREIVAGLSQAGVRGGWLLGESFGSQVVWAILEEKKLAVDGVILAGGFARHPAPWMATVAAKLCGNPSLALVREFLFGYEKAARYRFRRSPETRADLQQFIARRTEQDCRAARHRLRLVAGNNPSALLRQLQVPVYALTGFFDPIVPWYAARRRLKRECPTPFEHRVIWSADHNVLGTAPQKAAAQVLKWMKS